MAKSMKINIGSLWKKYIEKATSTLGKSVVVSALNGSTQRMKSASIGNTMGIQEIASSRREPPRTVNILHKG